MPDSDDANYDLFDLHVSSVVILITPAVFARALTKSRIINDCCSRSVVAHGGLRCIHLIRKLTTSAVVNAVTHSDRTTQTNLMYTKHTCIHSRHLNNKRKSETEHFTVMVCKKR